jgi:hypothetical protein
MVNTIGDIKMKKKQPYTVKVIDQKKADKLRQIKLETGISIERIVDQLIEVGLTVKKFPM